MNLQNISGQELIYYLYQKIKQCYLAYSAHVLQSHYNNQPEEQYKMDKEALIWMIREILKTGEYTLEGIAYHTRLPLEVISDAAIGLKQDISITLWFKIADLFFQIKDKKEH